MYAAYRSDLRVSEMTHELHGTKSMRPWKTQRLTPNFRAIGHACYQRVECSWPPATEAVDSPKIGIRAQGRGHTKIEARTMSELHPGAIANPPFHASGDRAKRCAQFVYATRKQVPQQRPVRGTQPKQQKHT